MPRGTDKCVRWGVAAATLIAVLATANTSVARQKPPTAPRRLVVVGYPYASRCPAAGVNDEVDRWKMNTCNCTSYVAWALTANGQRTAWFIPGDMDAHNWPHVASLSNFRTGSHPRVGAIAVWPKLFPPYGHVAYVTGVENNGTFDVAEYNFRPAAHSKPFAFDQRTHLPVHGIVFIYVPPRSRPAVRSHPPALARAKARVLDMRPRSGHLSAA